MPNVESLATAHMNTQSFIAVISRRHQLALPAMRIGETTVVDWPTTFRAADSAARAGLPDVMLSVADHERHFICYSKGRPKWLICERAL
jgi:hypothetical protein